jgi:hypothetical protein
MDTVGFAITHDPMLVETLMRASFDRPRTPRSKAYMQGAQWVLDFRIRGHRPPCPYKAGTAEADAFFAGRDEGNEIWRIYQAGYPAIIEISNGKR